jgi:hypothetical protein
MSFQKHVSFIEMCFIIEKDWVEGLQQRKFENVNV